MDILLDEHISRVFERVLRERNFNVTQAKDKFGEETSDKALLEHCFETNTVLITNNTKDFLDLNETVDHAGILLLFDQRLHYTNPEGLARTVEAVERQYGTSGLENEVVDLDHWYEWVRT